MTRLRPFALAAAAGVLHFLGFAGYGYWPLALVCLVPFWLALDATLAHPARGAAVGFVFGWVSYAGGYVWLWPALHVLLADVRLEAAVWFGDSLWFALRYALYAGLYGLVRRRGWPVAVAGVPALVVVEWLYPALFPVYFGHALAARTTVIQMSDLGGPLLLTVFAALLNAAACEAWCWRRGVGAPRATLAAAAVATALAWAYGTVRIAQVDRLAADAPALRVGVVQGNLGVQEKGAQAARDHRRYVEQTRELLAAGDVDLVVWPETVYTRGLRGPLPISGQLIRAGLPVPLLFGGVYVGTEPGRPAAHNSALLVDADGVIRSAYHKNLLIPFTEYVPFESVLGAWASAEQPTPPAQRARSGAEAGREQRGPIETSDFTAALDVPSLRFGTWRIATPICYEAVRPAFIRRMVDEGRPNLIVTIANDSWFGDSQAPRLHLDMATLRAVEHRRYLVRATNSGISAVVDATGRELTRAGLLTRENLRATVAGLDVVTPYTRFGDWVGWVCAAIVLAALLGTAGRKHRDVS